MVPGDGLCVPTSVVIQTEYFKGLSLGRDFMSRTIAPYLESLKETEYKYVEGVLQKLAGSDSKLKDKIDYYKKIGDQKTVVSDMSSEDMFLISLVTGPIIIYYPPNVQAYNEGNPFSVIDASSSNALDSVSLQHYWKRENPDKGIFLIAQSLQGRGRLHYNALISGQEHKGVHYYEFINGMYGETLTETRLLESRKIYEEDIGEEQIPGHFKNKILALIDSLLGSLSSSDQNFQEAELQEEVIHEEVVQAKNELSKGQKKKLKNKRAKKYTNKKDEEKKKEEQGVRYQQELEERAKQAEIKRQSKAIANKTTGQISLGDDESESTIKKSNGKKQRRESQPVQHQVTPQEARYNDEKSLPDLQTLSLGAKLVSTPRESNPVWPKVSLADDKGFDVAEHKAVTPNAAVMVSLSEPVNNNALDEEILVEAADDEDNLIDKDQQNTDEKVDKSTGLMASDETTSTKEKKKRPKRKKKNKNLNVQDDEEVTMPVAASSHTDSDHVLGWLSRFFDEIVNKYEKDKNSDSIGLMLVYMVDLFHLFGYEYWSRQLEKTEVMHSFFMKVDGFFLKLYNNEEEIDMKEFWGWLRCDFFLVFSGAELTESASKLSHKEYVNNKKLYYRQRNWIKSFHDISVTNLDFEGESKKPFSLEPLLIGLDNSYWYENVREKFSALFSEHRKREIWLPARSLVFVAISRNKIIRVFSKDGKDYYTVIFVDNNRSKRYKRIPLKELKVRTAGWGLFSYDVHNKKTESNDEKLLQALDDLGCLPKKKGESQSIENSRSVSTSHQMKHEASSTEMADLSVRTEQLNIGGEVDPPDTGELTIEKVESVEESETKKTVEQMDDFQDKKDLLSWVGVDSNLIKPFTAEEPETKLDKWLDPDRESRALDNLYRALKTLNAEKVANPRQKPVLHLHYCKENKEEAENYLKKSSQGGNGLADLILSQIQVLDIGAEKFRLIKEEGLWSDIIPVVQALRRAVGRGQLQALSWLIQLISQGMAPLDAQALAAFIRQGFSEGNSNSDVPLVFVVAETESDLLHVDSHYGVLSELLWKVVQVKQDKSRKPSPKQDLISFRKKLGHELVSNNNQSSHNGIDNRRYTLIAGLESIFLGVDKIDGEWDKLLNIRMEYLSGASNDWPSPRLSTISLKLFQDENKEVVDKLVYQLFAELMKFTALKLEDNEDLLLTEACQTGLFPNPNYAIVFFRKLKRDNDKLLMDKLLTQSQINKWEKMLLWNALIQGKADAPKEWSESFDDESGMARLAIDRFLVLLGNASFLKEAPDFSRMQKVVSILQRNNDHVLKDKVYEYLKNLTFIAKKQLVFSDLEEPIVLYVNKDFFTDTLIEGLNKHLFNEGSQISVQTATFLKDVFDRDNALIGKVFKVLPVPIDEQQHTEAANTYIHLAKKLAPEQGLTISGSDHEQAISVLLKAAEKLDRKQAGASIAFMNSEVYPLPVSMGRGVDPLWLETVLVPLANSAERSAPALNLLTKILLSYSDLRHLPFLMRIHERQRSYEGARLGKVPLLRPLNGYDIKLEIVPARIERMFPSINFHNRSIIFADDNYTKLIEAILFFDNSDNYTREDYMQRVANAKSLENNGSQDGVEWDYPKAMVLVDEMCAQDPESEEFYSAQKKLRSFSSESSKRNNSWVDINILSASLNGKDKSNILWSMEKAVLEGFGVTPVDALHDSLLPVKLLYLTGHYFHHNVRLYKIGAMYLDVASQKKHLALPQSEEKGLFLLEISAQLKCVNAYERIIEYWDSCGDQHKSKKWKARYQRFINIESSEDENLNKRVNAWVDSFSVKKVLFDTFEENFYSLSDSDKMKTRTAVNLMKQSALTNLKTKNALAHKVNTDQYKNIFDEMESMNSRIDKLIQSIERLSL